MTPKCVWRPGCARTRWGSYSTLPDPLAVIRERGRRDWKLGKERFGNREEGKG